MAATSIADDPLRGSRRLLQRVRGRRGPDHRPGEPPCRILVGGAPGLDRLESDVIEILALPSSTRMPLEHEGLRLTLGSNADAGPGDAGRWSHALELEPVMEVPHGRYVEIASSLLRGLWSRDLRAVAFCAFVHDLPTQSREATRRV